jgi:shikimate kinase
MSLLLVGYRGSGKSTVGRILAAQLGWQLVDTDELVVQLAGKTIREIFQEEGEPHFRDLESQALATALAQPGRIISTGGGIVMREANRALIRQSGFATIYLACGTAELFARICGDEQSAANRPHLTVHGGGVEEIRHMLEIREPLYREVATEVVAVGGKSAAEVARAILGLLGGKIGSSRA